MKRSIFCAVLALCLLMTAGALAERRGACEYAPLDEETAELVAYEGSAVTLDLPRTLDGYTLVSIASYAFAGNTTLREINLPDSITSIGNDAFEGCQALKRVTLPSRLEEMGDYAFASCPALTRVVFPRGLQEIPDCAFYNCPMLMSIDLPASVTRIGRGAFDGCVSLASVQLHRGLERIEEKAFAGCTTLEQVDLPDTVTWLSYGAFDNCANLKRVSLPAGLEDLEIGSRRDDPFWRCPQVVLEAEQGSRVYELFTTHGLPYEPVGGGRLARRDDWVYLDFELVEDDVAQWAEETELGGLRIVDYEGEMLALTLPETMYGYRVTAIRENAFLQCDLKTLTIPATVTEIGEDILSSHADTVVYVERGSCAEQYCRDNGIPYKFIQ